MKYWLFILSIALIPFSIYAESSPEQAAYQLGLKAYQEKNYDQAKEHFQSALAGSSENAFVLYNLGLTELQLKNLGMAAAAWRKALAIQPKLTPARKALEFLAQTTSISLPQDYTFLDRYRSGFTRHINFHQVFGVGLLLILSVGWIFIGYFSKRRQAIEEELDTPPFPWVGAGLFSLLAIAIFTAGIKAMDYYEPRATIIAQNVTIYSAPSAESSSLFQVPEGEEVFIKRHHESWTQVKSPGGLTGWMKNSQLFQTSGRKL